MEKQNVVNWYSAVLFSNKNKWATKPWKDIRNLNAHSQVKEAGLKHHLPYDSNYVAFWKRQNYRHIKKVSSCSRLRGGIEDENLEPKGLFAWQKCSMWYSNGGYKTYIFQKVIELYSRESELSHELWASVNFLKLHTIKFPHGRIIYNNLCKSTCICPCA